MGIAKELTIAQIWAASSTVLLVLIAWSKGWKIVFGTEFGKDLKNGFPLVQKWLFKNAIFRKDIHDIISKMAGDMEIVKHEMQYNGGSSTKDAVLRLEKKQDEMMIMIQHNKALRDITDLCSNTMIFRMHPERGCTFINDSFLQYFGVKESDTLEFGYENLVHDDDVQEMRLKWEKAITSRTSFKDEHRIRDTHGNWYTCMVRGFPVIVGGRLIEFSGTIEIIKPV